MAILGAIIILVVLFLGAPIFAVLTGAGAFGATFGRGMVDFSGQISNMMSMGMSEQATILSTIPLFILAGYFLAAAKTAERLVKVSQAGLGWLPASLAIVTIFACAIFTTFTGASGVTIVALGGLLMPALAKQNYPEKFSLGLIGGTGSVGLLFPPAVPLFIYGTVFGFVYQTTSDSGVGDMQLVDWDTERFIFAGVVPGTILIGVISLYSVFQASRHGIKPNWSRAEFKTDFFPALLRALPELSIPFLVILGIVNGVTIPQAAALTVAYVFVIEFFFYKDLTLAKLPNILRESMALVGAIFIIVFAATGFSNWLVTAEVPQELLVWVRDTFESKTTFLLALNVVLLVVGMTMDIFAAIVVVVPLMTPTAMAYGINPYHLGVIFLLNLEIGYLTPPVGLNLFITSHTFRKPMDKVIGATFPFLLCMVATLLLVTYIPSLTIYPEAQRRGLVAEMHSRVVTAVAQETSLQELTLPDGRILKVGECEAITDSLSKQECVALFQEVTACRKKAQTAAQCESALIAEYLANQDDADDSDDDDWDTDDADDDDNSADDNSDDDWNTDVPDDPDEDDDATPSSP